jgi:hypothetical protein
MKRISKIALKDDHQLISIAWERLKLTNSKILIVTINIMKVTIKK